MFPFEVIVPNSALYVIQDGEIVPYKDYQAVELAQEEYEVK